MSQNTTRITPGQLWRSLQIWVFVSGTGSTTSSTTSSTWHNLHEVLPGPSTHNRPACHSQHMADTSLTEVFRSCRPGDESGHNARDSARDCQMSWVMTGELSGQGGRASVYHLSRLAAVINVSLDDLGRQSDRDVRDIWDPRSQLSLVTISLSLSLPVTVHTLHYSPRSCLGMIVRLSRSLPVLWLHIPGILYSSLPAASGLVHIEFSKHDKKLK